MMALTAEILKIDYNYKIVRKVRIWTSQTREKLQPI
jgi:hypothetical protein